MRLLLVCVCVCVCVGLGLAGPAKKKIAKKSISNGLAAKAIEPVDQKLDEPAKLSDEALMEIAGENVDRAKKQASTTFCVEIRQNKPTQVDCDELNNRPLPPPPPPPPAPAPEPQEPVPPPPPPPAAPPAPVPQQQPEDLKFELPCEPEMAAFYVQPPGEIVYAPTGNCAPHVPALLHLPTGGPVYSLPAGGASATPSISVLHLPGGSVPAAGSPGASALPPINVLHLPSGSVPAAGSPGASALPSINLLHLPTGASTGHGSGSDGVSPTVIPLHTGGGSGIIPHVLHHGIHHGALPLHGHGGLHGIHHLSGVECTCKSTPGALSKSADGTAPSNEALAMKFLQDLQRNAQSQPSGTPSNPMMVQVGPGMSPSMMRNSGLPGSPITMNPSGGPMMMLSPGPGSGKSEMRYMPLVRPMSNVQQQVVYQQQASSLNGMGGMGIHGYPMHGLGGIGHGMYPGVMLRSKADCLQDSFGNSAQVLPQGLRLSREEAEATAAAAGPEPKPEEKPEEGKPSPSEIIEAMKKQSEEPNNEEKNSRIARFLMEKNVESNVLDEK